MRYNINRFFHTFSITLLTLAAASPVGAYFERLEVGGRALSLGQSFHAIADDPSALYWNPAGMAGTTQPALLLDYYKPYTVEDLSSSFASFTYPGLGGHWGVAWHYFGLSGVERENLFSVAYANQAELPFIGKIALGVTGKVLRVSYTATPDRSFLGNSVDVTEDYGGQTELSADFGLLYRPSDRLAIGAIVRNMIEPTFDFIEGSGGTRIPVEVEGSFAYHWNDASVITVGVAETRKGSSALSVGGEVTFFDVFSLRSGIFDAEFWGGFGLLSSGWTLDSGFVTHKALGVSYMASLTILFGENR